MEKIRALLAAGQRQEAIAALHAHIAARQDEPGGHEEEARLAEELGLSSAAVRAWQLALRDHPEDLAAWSALAALYEERGERERAAACASKAGLTESPPAPDPDEALPGPTEADLVRFVYLFGGREDVHARMYRDARGGVGYSPVQQPLTPEVARAHLSGAITAGSYLVRHDDRCQQLVFDLDATQEALSAAAGDPARARALREAIATAGLQIRAGLRALGLDPLLVDSGYKGRHLWVLLDAPAPAGEVLEAGQRLAAALRPASPHLRIEVFPKQAHVPPGGLGNLVKLPLGLHLRTGRRAALLDEAGQPLADPFAALRAVRRGPLPPLHGLPEAPPPPPPDREDRPPAPAAPGAAPWTEADFETSRQVGPVLSGCAVLRGLVDGVIQDRALSADGARVLDHTLGHLADGVRAIHYLFDRLPDIPAAAHLPPDPSPSPLP